MVEVRAHNFIVTFTRRRSNVMDAEKTSKQLRNHNFHYLNYCSFL